MAASQRESHRGRNTVRQAMHSINSYSIHSTCSVQSYIHLFVQTHPHTLLPVTVVMGSNFLLFYISVLFLLALSQTNNTQSSTCKNELFVTFHIDINGGLLLGALLQADVAAHVSRLSPGDVQRRHPISLFLSPHLRPLLPMPLHCLYTLATQLKRCIKQDNDVGAGRCDRGLGVAYNEIE